MSYFLRCALTGDNEKNVYFLKVCPQGELKEGGRKPYFLKMTPRGGGIEKNNEIIF